MCGMKIGPPTKRDSKIVRRGIWREALALGIFFFCGAGIPAQQPASPRSARQSGATATAKRNPRLLEAETLLKQGSIGEAKKKIQEELERDPPSVEAYNLLGIAYTSEKDYPGATEAFQQALKLDPNSTEPRNN